MTLATSPHLACAVDVDGFHADGYLRLRLTRPVFELILDITRIGRAMFRQPEAAKRGDRLDDAQEGWQAFGGEFSVSLDRPDLHESFWVTHQHATRAAQAYSALARALHGKMLAYLSIVQEIEGDILRALVDHYGLEIDRAAQVVGSIDSDIQLLYYQPARESRTLLQDPHEDSLSLTFTRADGPGLELLDHRGQYRSPDLAADELVVLPGEIMTLLSGGRIRPQLHRVVRHLDLQERLTLSYFSSPDLASHRQIPAWITSPINEGVCIADRVRANRLRYLVP